MSEQLKLKTKFIEGLKKFNISYETFINDGWKYCGGDYDYHLNYYKNFKHKKILSKDDFPKHADTCICGHYIKYNCYITNNKDILVLGNCCIKKFCPISYKTCEICNNKHKNKKNNMCNKCRIICTEIYYDYNIEYNNIINEEQNELYTMLDIFFNLIHESCSNHRLFFKIAPLYISLFLYKFDTLEKLIQKKEITLTYNKSMKYNNKKKLLILTLLPFITKKDIYDINK